MLLYWVFGGFLEEELKVGQVGRGKDSRRTWGKEEYDQNTLKLKIVLNNKNVRRKRERKKW